MNSLENLVEIKLFQPDDFLKIKETLTRIGYSSNSNLYQSCHIYHKRGKYYITHFKEMFLLDGQNSSITENDYGRRNTISLLLEEWGLLEIVNPEIVETPTVQISQIKIVSFKDKKNWNLIPKYNIGIKK